MQEGCPKCEPGLLTEFQVNVSNKMRLTLKERKKQRKVGAEDGYLR